MSDPFAKEPEPVQGAGEQPVAKPEETPVPLSVIEPVPLPRTTEPASDSVRMDIALRSTEQPISDVVVREARLGLDDLSPEYHLALATSAFETIGKASGFLPSFPDLTENMKGAYLRVVRDIWIAAQKKVRSYNE